MRAFMWVCKECRRYTLKNACPDCGIPTMIPLPPRYSPEDRLGGYRRKLKKMGAA